MSIAEPTIICPNCKAEIKLTESLAAPLVEAIQRDYAERLTQKEADMAKRLNALREREEAIAKDREALDDQVTAKVKQERSRIAAEEAKKARVALADDIDQKTSALVELQNLLKAKEQKLTETQQAQVDLLRKQRELEDAKREMELTVENRIQDGLAVAREQACKETEAKLKAAAEQREQTIAEMQDKLAEAQKAQAELIRKQRELDDARREMELTIEKRVQESLSLTRDRARKEAEESLKFKVLEKEQTITSMQKQIEELKRRAEQGSQQLQGEVQELELEALLRAKFLRDTIALVPKGEHGGDVLQRVISAVGQSCGTILWESKRTKNWSDSWLAKLRDDQRAAKAEVSVLVTQALPKEVEAFDLIEGVWVIHPRVAIPVAIMLRQSLAELSMARQASEGQQTKTEMLYTYLTGPRFRLRVQAIVEAFSNMKEDLDREKRAITKQWAKRDEQIERVMQATVGMYGDMQGIAGKTLQEIEGLEMKALNPSPEDVNQ